MNTVFFLCVFISMLCLLFTSPLEILPAISVGTQGAVSLCLSLTASFALWGGFTEIAKHTGAQRGLANLLRKPLSFLFGKTEKGATEDIATNLSANFLGLGNAATPFGLAAMQELDMGNPIPGRATDDMCMFLCINASAIQLLPTTVISLMVNAGSRDPYCIVLPTLIATMASGLTGIVLCKFFASRSKSHA